MSYIWHLYPLKHVFIYIYIWTNQHRLGTWEDRSAHTVWPSSWTVTDLTPDRITFLAISTPRPRMPAMRTSAVPIRCIASWPRTYLRRWKNKWICGPAISATEPSSRQLVPQYLQLPGVESFVDLTDFWHVARAVSDRSWAGGSAGLTLYNSNRASRTRNRKWQTARWQ